jgi:hypothetical protein
MMVTATGPLMALDRAEAECAVEFMAPPAQYRAQLLTGDARASAWARVAGRTHQASRSRRPRNWAFPPKGHAPTVPNARYVHEPFEDPSPLTSFLRLQSAARVYRKPSEPYWESLSGV